MTWFIEPYLTLACVVSLPDCDERGDPSIESTSSQPRSRDNGALMDVPGNDVLMYIPNVKHQVLRFIIDRLLKDLRPVFDIGVLPKNKEAENRQGAQGEYSQETSTVSVYGFPA